MPPARWPPPIPLQRRRPPTPLRRPVPRRRPPPSIPIYYVQTALKGQKVDSFATTPPGLYEVVIGGQVLYLSEDGRFVVEGEIVNLSSFKID